VSVRSLRYSDLSLRLPKGTSALPIERDAWAFLDAAGITSALQQRAIVQLVRDLKKANLWTKMKAVYPFVGGTATSHKWNLKNPQDTDAAFRLTFSGGWTHSSTGALPNGTNAYANTFLKQSANLALHNSHISYYSRNATFSGNRCFGGAITNGSTYTALDAFYMFTGSSNNRILAIQNSEAAVDDFAIVTNQSTKAGHYINSRTSATATTLKLFQNGTSIANATTSTSGQVASTLNVYIAAQHFSNLGSIQFYEDSECGFFTLGDGLNDAEAKLLYECVDRYQKTLGRAV